MHRERLLPQYQILLPPKPIRKRILLEPNRPTPHDPRPRQTLSPHAVSPACSPASPELRIPLHMAWKTADGGRAAYARIRRRIGRVRSGHDDGGLIVVVVVKGGGGGDGGRVGCSRSERGRGVGAGGGVVGGR